MRPCFDTTGNATSRNTFRHCERVLHFIGGPLKERRHGFARTWSSKHLKIDNKKLSTKTQSETPQERFTLPGSRPLEQNTHTHSHEDKNGLLETQRSNLRQRCSNLKASINHFGDNLSGQEVYSPNLPMVSPKKATMDSPFWSWTVVWRRHRILDNNLGNSLSNCSFWTLQMHGCCLGRIFVGVPVICPQGLSVRVSTFDRRFLAVGCEQSPEQEAKQHCHQALCTLYS